MYWKVAGFSQPSPVEQILDKEEYTLEELLDEDDIIQECKSLNGRLVAFLRERSSVEQLIRYLVEPQDSDDPKRTYKYPFTSCEVLCCEVEAVYNTLLEDAELMQLLFSLLEQPAPLNCKTAGYFGRVVGTLLLRKAPEMLEFMQREGTPLLAKLVKHVDTTSVADIIKRMVGADDQSSLMGAPSPAMSPWLAGTPLLDLLLARLDSSNSAEAQGNAADILSATAHTQPSALAAKLAQPAAVAALIGHALAPGRHVLVPALDVCIALLEPRRAALGDALTALSEPAGAEAADVARRDAVAALVEHVPRLVELLSLEPSSTAAQDTPYGRLAPPLGRHRLKVVELLAALVRSGQPIAEDAVIKSAALPQCMRLFAAFPFNNLLHHSVAAVLQTCIGSEAMSAYLLEECGVLDWIVGLPTTITPPPVLGDEAHAASKAPLRAGYLGHVTQIAGHLVAAGPAGSAGGSGASEAEGGRLSKYTRAHERWCQYVEDALLPRQDLENTSSWACGRPPAQPLPGLDSDGDDFSNEMDLDQITGLQQPLFHRYAVNEEEDAEDDDDGDEPPGGALGSSGRVAGAFDLGSDMLAEAMSRMELEQRDLAGGAGGFDGSAAGKTFWMAYRQDEDGDAPLGFASPAAQAQSHSSGMDDDDVLLGADDEDGGSPEGRARQESPSGVGQASPGPPRTPGEAGAVGEEGQGGASSSGSGGSSPLVQDHKGSPQAPAQQQQGGAGGGAAAAPFSTAQEDTL